MTDEINQEQGQRKKRADVTLKAIDKAREDAIAAAKAEGVEIDPTWSIDRIEQATLAAMIAKEDARRIAEAEAKKPAPEAPSLAGENPEDRAEVMKTAHEHGMDLEDLKGRPIEEVLTMIGKHMTETALKEAAAKEEARIGRVKVRVLKNGDNKISKGIHIPGVGDLKHKAGDIFEIRADSARQLEERGFVEIETTP